jgi:hypothetical protein
VIRPREPAPLGKLLVTARVADEAGIELNRLAHERSDIGDEVIGNAGPAEKDFGDFPAGPIYRVNSHSRWALVVHGFQSPDGTQIKIRENCIPANGPVEVRTAEIRAAEVRLAENCPAEVRPAKVRLAEVRPAEIRPVEVRPDEVRNIVFRCPPLIPLGDAFL